MFERPTALDLLAGATAFLLPVAYLPFVDAPFWSPKVAVLLPATAVGLTCIPALLRTELRRATLAALVFLVVARSRPRWPMMSARPCSASTTRGPASSSWSRSSGCGPSGHRRAVGAGRGWSSRSSPASASPPVGVLQVSVDFGVPFLGVPVGSRAAGLAGNPVHLAALATGVVALAAAKAHDHRWWLVAIGAGASVVQLSGSRFALLLLPVVVIALLAQRGWRLAVASLVCIVLGLAVGSGVAARAGRGTSSSGRLTTMSAATGGITSRLRRGCQPGMQSPTDRSSARAQDASVSPHHPTGRWRWRGPRVRMSSSRTVTSRARHSSTTSVLSSWTHGRESR